MTIRVLIVDDEPVARTRIRRLLRGTPDVEIVGECEDGRSAVESIQQLRPDVVFLDIQMPEMDGFDTLAAVPESAQPLVVFVTAYDEYALRAFEVHAFDYLLKPFDSDRFRNAFARVRKQLEGRQAPDMHAVLSLLQDIREGQERSLEHTGAPAQPRFLDRLMIRTDGRFTFLKVAEIDWFDAAGNYVRVHSPRGAFLVRDSLASLEERLDPQSFVRIHRSTIVRLDAVKEMQAWFSGDHVVILHNGTRLKLSRSYRDHVRERMGSPS
jgi:two-component system LytT family response regulator